MTENSEAQTVGRPDYRRPSAECDIVMEGGITSGVVYPLAVCRLAERYRVRNIGGASAGAIAAGFASAAEIARYTGGYDRLRKIPNNLGKNLDKLFQAPKSTRPAMKVLLAWLSPSGSKAVKTVFQLVRLRFAAFALGFLTIAVLFVAGLLVPSSPVSVQQLDQLVTPWLIIPVAFLGIIAGLIAATAAMAVQVMKKVPANYFGLATGMTEERGKGPGLTEWLHTQVQDISGLGKTDPLTFRHLWEANGPGDERGVNLEMMTTDLTEGLPYRIPFEGRRLAYCPDCFRRLFPEQIVTHMDQNSDQVRQEGNPRCPDHPEVALCHLPQPENLPVLVAMRMSLSFPILISAIPLHKRDFSRKRGKQDWVRHWFSDGGIGSNFPVHFFDSLWPSRPTFALDLQEKHPDYPDADWYLRFQGRRAQPRTYEIDGIPGFLGRIANTMQKWRDRSLALAVGYADRVVTIYTKKTEGGMNLRMPPDVIEDLSQRGAGAAAEYDAFDFDYHRWERYRTSMSELDWLLTDLRHRYDERGMRSFIEVHETDSYIPDSDWCDGIIDPWRQVDQDNTLALMNVAQRWNDRCHTAQQRAPKPSPVFRLEPRQTEAASEE